jgi:hypothetical protein
MNNTTNMIYTSSSVSNGLLSIPHLINIWIGAFLWITGNVGCIGNMIVFMSQEFRNRAYSIYLFSQSNIEFVLF